MNLLGLSALFAGGLLFAGVLTPMILRRQLMVRLYATASLFLAGLTITLALLHNSPHLYLAAGATILIKVLAIPMIIEHMARRARASTRLTSKVRPTTTLFLVVGVLMLVMFSLRGSSFFQTVEPSYMLFVSVSMVLIGFLMMVLRRDIFSEIIGFLTLENGISLFGIVTIGSGPVMVEMGIFSAILIGAVLMTLLSRRICELYGTDSTDPMNELID